MEQGEKITCEEENELVRRAAGEKDQRALARLLVKYHPLFMRVVHDTQYKILGDDVQALAQLFFLEAVNTFEAGRGVPFAAYLKNLLAWRLGDFVKGAVLREKNEVRTDGLLAPAGEGGEGEPVSIWDAIFLGGGENQSPSAELGGLGRHMDGYERIEFEDSLQRALGELSDRERQVVTGIYLQDRSAREVAEKLGLSPSRVSHIRERALGKLRALLGEL